MLKKVIRSHLGEVTQDHRTVGDRIRYRIYYGSQRIARPINPEITIIDQVDKNLEKITVFNDGVYDLPSRTIRWIVPARRASRNPYVEFEAVVSTTGVVKNQAHASGQGVRRIKSNIVETSVSDSPPLGWIPFHEDEKDGSPPRAYMKDETTSGITVRFDIPGLFIYEEKVAGVTYQHITIPSRAGLDQIGKPELPIVSEIIEVPFGVNFTPEITKAETIQLTGYNVYPAQEPRIERVNPDNPDLPAGRIGRILPPHLVLAGRQPSFRLDTPTYQADADFPSSPFTIHSEDIGVIRGRRVLLLQVNPVLYNPVERKLTVFTTLEVRVNFSHSSQIKGVDHRLVSPDFERYFSATLLNYKPYERFMTEGGAKDDQRELTGCDYLIITHDTFNDVNDANNPVVRFANWKRCKGYRTKVVNVGSIPGGNTANSIQAYIQGAYDTWNPAPSYVLLIGDSDLVRSVMGAHHPGENDPNSPQPQIETDLYYVTVDGTDYFPDMYIGRMSADNTQQVTDIVDKIINYEKNPPATPANADFYTNISLVGLFTETDETPSVITGEEDRPWIANMETIRNFMQNQGYTVERIYATDTGFPANPAAQEPLCYHDGTNLPNNLRHPQYGWDGGTNQITNAFNNGRFLMTYRAHGGWAGWAHPAFHIANIPGLIQNDLTPLLISITCQAGWFDNETDDNSHGGRPVGDDCFAEVMLRRPHLGAIGLLAMTRNSYTGPNDFLVFGTYKAIWPTFNPDPPWAGHPAAPAGQQVSLRKLGQISNFSKMYMARAYGPSNTRLIEFEMHHLFGDPETTLWTSAPRELKVEQPKAVGAVGLQEFIIKVSDKDNGQPVHNATVVLTRDDQIVQMQQTRTDGVALFSLNPAGSGDLNLTVTALDYRPFMRTLSVTSNGAELNRLDPNNGPENQVISVGGRYFQAGENVEMYFGSHGPTIATAGAGGEFGQGIPTVNLTVPNNHPHGLVNVTAHGQNSDRYAVRVFQVRDQNPVDLWTYDQWNSSTWTVHPGDNPTWNSPDIQLYDDSHNPVASNNLVLGKTYTVEVTVRNKAAFPAPHASVVFQWENYGAGGPWQALPPVIPVDAPAHPGTVVAQTNFQPHATGHLCLRVNIEHIEDIDTTNNTGQENLHVGYSNSPTEACFLVWNPTNNLAPVYFEVRQLFTPNDPQRIYWASWVKHPDPQFLKPGDRAEACVIVDPDKADVRPGTKAEFAVTCFVGDNMIGGVNLIIIKK
jgi:hypothetical protein